MLAPEQWSDLEAATTAGPVRYRMTGAELLLYRTAIETGLRSNELRSLTRTSVVLHESRPFIRAKAAATKNHKYAQQFIERSLAAQPKAHVAKKALTANLFDLPDPTDMAAMIWRPPVNPGWKSPVATPRSS